MEDGDIRVYRSVHTSAAPLYVSLFTLLLAFFIMLNAISNFNTGKARKANSSIETAFFDRSLSKSLPQHYAETIGTEEGKKERLFREMRGVADSSLPLIKIQTETYGNVMEVRLPLEFVFGADSSGIRDICKSFLTRLVSVLSAQEEGVRIDVEAVVSTKRHLSLFGASIAARDTEMLQAGLLARYLTELGIPQKSLATGIRADGRNSLLLTFTFRDTANASLNLDLPREPTP